MAGPGRLGVGTGTLGGEGRGGGREKRHRHAFSRDGTGLGSMAEDRNDESGECKSTAWWLAQTELFGQAGQKSGSTKSDHCGEW